MRSLFNCLFLAHSFLYQIICLEEFKTFEDKSSAINDTGVNSELTDMIRRCCPWQMLAVGNLKYKRIIETSLDVPCLCNEIVMEVMWGLKNLMHVLVPEEKLKLKKQDRLPMSYGLKKLLDRYGFDVKPRMINEEIVVGSCVVHDSDFCEKKLSTTLSEGGHLLQEVSGINSEGWDLMKLATALKIIAYPPRTTTAETELFTEHEISKLLMDAHKYEGKIAKGGCLEIYKQMVEIRDFRARAKKTMVFLVKEAERAYEAKRRATRKKLYMKLVKEAQSSKRRAKKKSCSNENYSPYEVLESVSKVMKFAELWVAPNASANAKQKQQPADVADRLSDHCATAGGKRGQNETSKDGSTT
ncbi:hypothetical protein PR202_ga09856 [Eleusine coracana subsp. coracana]|uniref:Uncharacterized protein n=1 Tax=Eleusine coracana subsp. coracana TaxID=191504 RepID=A0AAV5C5B7_ELECO|nr:hypothetical protein PR202_ga09856 [Eleusine coracana subsp. coracana]